MTAALTRSEVEALIEDKIAAFHWTLIKQGRLTPPLPVMVTQPDAECSAEDCKSGSDVFLPEGAG
jgi:hypothetical protein